MLSSGLEIHLLPLLLLLLTAMELSWSFTDEEKKLIVDLHNQYRSKVSPPAANMLKMSWDPELEAFAKDYATQCIWEHNKNRGRRGENLFATSADLDVKIVVDTWYNEYLFYNMTTSTCEEGQMCGHYTQVVWANSERVGCETVFCDTLENLNDTDMHLVVCNYEPPGNVKGHKPYKEGTPCSMCPDDYSCKDNLCGPTSSLDLISDQDLKTSLELQTNSDGDIGTLVTTEGLDLDSALSPASPDTGTQQVAISEFPSSDATITPKANLFSPLSTLTPAHTTPKALPPPKPASPPKPPSTPKPPSPSKPPSVSKPPSPVKPPSIPKPPSPSKPPSFPKHPFFSKLPSSPKKPIVSKKPAHHRLAAYSKAIKRNSNAFQSTSGKAASFSVCLPCLGCKQVSQPEEIRTAYKELTSRYPYAPCFSPLPRWRRHSKCPWCGHTWGNALSKIRPYWLNSL
uniref:Peptidase inhibitor 16 n=1 Tax=Salvator merianae TaxID=96440 RepID=A0A8D0KN54_SALMN